MLKREKGEGTLFKLYLFLSSFLPKNLTAQRVLALLIQNFFYLYCWSAVYLVCLGCSSSHSTGRFRYVGTSYSNRGTFFMFLNARL